MTERKKLQDYLVSAVQRVDNLVNEPNERMRRHISGELREALASQIEYTGVRKTKFEYHTEYRCEVYVIPVDEMRRLVLEEAIELGYVMPLQVEKL